MTERLSPDERRKILCWSKGNQSCCAAGVQILWRFLYDRAYYYAKLRSPDRFDDPSERGQEVVLTAFPPSLEDWDCRLTGGQFFTTPRGASEIGRVGRFTSRYLEEGAKIGPESQTANVFYEEHFRPWVDKQRELQASTLVSEPQHRLSRFLDSDRRVLTDGLRLSTHIKEWAQLADGSEKANQSQKIAFWTLVLYALKAAQYSKEPGIRELVTDEIESTPIPPAIVSAPFVAWLERYTSLSQTHEGFEALSCSDLQRVALSVVDRDWMAAAEILDEAAASSISPDPAEKGDVEYWRRRLKKLLIGEAVDQAKALLASVEALAVHTDLGKFEIEMTEWWGFVCSRIDLPTPDARWKAKSRVKKDLVAISRDVASDGCAT